MAVGLAVSGAGAWAGPPAGVPEDVALVTQLDGAVVYRSVLDRDKEQEAVPFMKVRVGDRFRLEKGARLRLLYYRAGRQEQWKGPARFRAARDQSRTRGKVRPKVERIPVRASRDVRRVPALMRRVGGSRVGATVVRGAGDEAVAPVALSPEEKAELEAARTLYASLREKAPDDDITPELYLLGVLFDYERYEDMKTVVERARARQPGNQALADIKAWLARRRQADTTGSNP